MTASLWLRDLVSYSVQVTMAIGLGAALARVFAPRASAATAAYWQALLVACLLLPVCQPWKDAPSPSILAARPGPAAPSPPSPPERADLSRAILIVLAAGTAGRGAWLALGLWNLRRLRRQASPIPPGRLPAGLAGRARRSIHLRPAGRARRPGPAPPGHHPAAQRPRDGPRRPAGHPLPRAAPRLGLLDPGRGGARAAWFHPLIWWLVARIQLAREQAVDQGVVGLVPSRERYVEALLAVARARTQAGLVPAPLLLRKGSLKKRVAEILKETTMTRRRLFSFLTISAAALLLATIATVRRFPLEARASEPVVAGDAAKDGRWPAEKDETVMKELRKALEHADADPDITPEQKAKWKQELAELEAKARQR